MNFHFLCGGGGERQISTAKDGPASTSAGWSAVRASACRPVVRMSFALLCPCVIDDDDSIGGRRGAPAGERHQRIFGWTKGCVGGVGALCIRAGPDAG